MPSRLLHQRRGLQLERLKIPLAKPYVSREHYEAVRAVLDSGRFVQGNETRDFEKEFANFLGRKHAVAASSGTAALHLALLSTGIREEDEVITVSHTFIATIASIWYVRARPKLVDIDEQYYVMDVSNARALVSKKTRAIIPVHIFGHPVDMDPVRDLASENGLVIIEDAAQAHGTRYKGKPVGALGDVACFSFYPSKNLTVCGDGGMLVTDDDKIAEKARMLRDHGRIEKYSSEVVGYNYRISEIASAIGRVGLKFLAQWNEERRSIASQYGRTLSKIDGLLIPAQADWAYHVYHMYAIRSKRRDALLAWLAKHGVQTGIHYPIPCHLQPVFTKMERGGVHLRNTEAVAQELLSLPIYSGMTKEEVEYVVSKVREFHEMQR